MSESRPTILPVPFFGGGVHLFHIHEPAGLICEPHHHLYHEIDYILSGRGVFAVGASKVEVATGDVMYLARGVHHWRKNDPKHPLEFCNLVLDDLSMRRVIDASLPSLVEDSPWWRHWPARDLDDPEIRKFLNRLVKSMHPPARQLSPAKARSLMLPGLGQLLMLSRTRTQAAPPGLHRLARRVRQKPHCPLDLDEEAARLGISRWWLSRAFKRYFGVSLWEHRDYARMEQAIKLLQTSDITVRDLGRRVGFAGTAQFINTFKRLTGLTPEKLRRRYAR